MPVDVIKTSFRLDLGDLKKLVSDVDAARGVIEGAWWEIAEIYRAFILRRYKSFSKGGGNWPPLAEATVKAKGSSAILIDTGVMVGALKIKYDDAPGALQRLFSNRKGIRVGFSRDPHPSAGGLTVADLASIHHLGQGRVPKRTILIQPDDKTIGQMVKAIEKAIDKWQKGNK